MEPITTQHPGSIIVEQFNHLKNSLYHLGRASAFEQIIVEITTGTCMSCSSSLLPEVENYLVDARTKVEREILHTQITDLKEGA